MTEQAVKYPADEWIRTVTFMDNGRGNPEDAPVHVPMRVFINGTDVAHRKNFPDTPDDPMTAMKGLRIRNDYPVSASSEGIGRAPTLVTFVIHRDDLTLNDLEGDNPEIRIGPWKVLCPPMSDRDDIPGLPWGTVETDDAGDEWVEVYFYAEEVLFGQVGTDQHVPDTMGDVDRVVLYRDRSGKYRWAYRAAGNASNMGGPQQGLADREQALSNAARITHRELVTDISETKGFDGATSRLLLVDLT